MTILDELSSSLGERTEDANRAVATKVEVDLALLDEIAAGLTASDRKLVGDCAEVFTMIAEKQPRAVTPYISQLVPLLKAKSTRIRWEVMHMLVFVARQIPDRIGQLVPQLADSIARDRSVIVRDYAVQTLREYAATNVTAAQTAYPHLVKSLDLWNSKHAHLALEGMTEAATMDQTLVADVVRRAQTYVNHDKPKVRRAAKAVLKYFT